MKYVQPTGEAEGTSYTDGDPALGITGSIPPAAALEHPQREILNVITAAGLTPDENNLAQMSTAVGNLVASGMSSYAKLDMSNVSSASVLSKIGTDTITGTHLASGSVSAAKVVDDSVTIAKIAPGTAGKVIGFDGSGAPAEMDLATMQADMLDAFATKVLVDMSVTEAANSYGTYELLDATQGGMTISGDGTYLSGNGYAWGATVDVALGSTASSSSDYNTTDVTAAKAVDGSSLTQWYNAQGTWPHWWQTDLGQAEIIDYIEIADGDFGLGSNTLAASNDGTNWTDLASGVGNGIAGVLTYPLNGVDAWRYFRVTAHTPYDSEDVYWQHYASIRKFMALKTSGSSEGIFTSSGIPFAKANPSDVALYALITEGGTVTEGVDRIFELADGSGGSIGTYNTPSSIDDLGLFLGRRLIRANFDLSATPATSCTYRIRLNNVAQTIFGAVVLPLYY